ncbi:NAD-dependent epimerase/dehydratase family protein [Elizabethkingia sp. JS20170427COW]|uniref:NAD-dependent epimerase/dehydratase family protein n=1 Tax=Elizabethkingia sp. JS20170427COW TaxID=2583851 RepID=UPI001110D0EE|nr:NAD-dependent epimerase/dehydratase family protein [Elizabethkingia sp. JS20170427COW]QCX54043.1 NAD-dependent epimerase/dehydratase family protein [Elizabethkingia sp. JS20170427COW]
MILVTGATGILGSQILLQLLMKGEKVVATRRSSSKVEELRKIFSYYTDQAEKYYQQIEWRNIDFQDIDSISAVLEGITKVYHCAASVSFHPKDKNKLYHTNIEGTRNLLYACEGSSVTDFCFISSIAVLDGINENGEMDEFSDFKSALPHSPYSKSKHFSEMEVWRASAEGLNVVILLPGVILGSGNWSQSSGVLFSTLEKNKFNFSGGTSYVDVRDVAKIGISLMDEKAFGERYIVVAGQDYYKNVATKVRQKLGLSQPSIISDELLKFARFFKFLGFLIPSLQLLTKENIEALTSYHKISNQKVKNRLDYQFISIDESIDFHLQHYINDKKNYKS